MTRVLLGDFGAIVRLGLREVLEARQLQLTEEEPSESLLDQLLDTLPDAVVLDLDVENTVELARRITTRFPALTVIACSSDVNEPRMRVYPPFHHGESYTAELTSTSLVAALDRTTA